SGNEWIALYNSGQVEVDISGWTLETTHGKTVTVTIPQGTIIPSKGYWNYIHKKQWLDNEDELIILKDSEGVKVDRTLMASDRDNDNRYWTRYPDGLDTNSDSDWRFREHILSKGIMRSGTVKYVGDGDTIDIIFAPENKDIRGIQRIRLVGIDAPELDTVEGKKVKELVEKMCLGKVVEIEVDDERQYDKYHRILAVLYIDALNLNSYLLREGYATPLVISPSKFIPYASFTYSPEKMVVNQAIKFDASSSYSLDPDAVIISYKWNFGDDTVGEGKVMNHSYSSSGDYTAALTVVDSDGKITRENIRAVRIIIK
ncbi:MAG: PKD domain-containing protein, partial [candidate division WOR-3 bacterium]|nr:PKD domain-containing protein [candidate division WOR-3 bacterium]